MSGRPPESAAFDVTRVSSSRGGPPVLVVGFVAVFAGVVALGMSGRAPEAPVAVATPAPTVIIVPAQRGPQVFPSTGPAPSLGRTATVANVRIDPVRLLFPRRNDELILTSTISVVGSLAFRAQTIRFELLTDGRDLLDARTLDTGDGQGIRPDHLPTFDLDLRVPPRTATGTLWIVITAFDQAGAKLDSFTRTIRFGAGAGA